MRPVLQKNSNRKLWWLYALIFIICVVGIGVALYLQHFKDEKIEIAFGFTDKESEKQDEYNELKEDFEYIFTNDFEILQENVNVEKISDKFDIIVKAYNFEKNDENITINATIPNININNDYIKQINQRIKKTYKDRAEALINQVSSMNVIYSVEYKAYIQNNIISLIIKSEYKEGTKGQSMMIETFNYSIAENKEVTIEEMLNLKGISVDQANSKIKNEIKTIQEQNQQLIDQGYAFYKRDYTSDRYNVSNVKQFLYGKDGMIYIIYPYGNNENTTETDVVIFE